MAVLIARDMVHEPLHIVVPVQNPWRWKSRYKHTTRALKHFIDSGAVVTLVEIAFNRRDLVFADSGIDGLVADCGIHGTEFRHKYIGFHSGSEVWLKECAVNLGVQSFPYTWQNMAWLDSDVHFIRPNWTGECIQKLQHYSFLQMFSQARDLAPNYEMLPEDYPHANGVSWVKSWRDGDLDDNLANKKKPVVQPDLTQPERQKIISDLQKIEGDILQLSADIQQLAEDIMDYDYYGGKRVFPGLAWAATRKAWDDVGGLPDFACWSGGDWSMAHALIGKRESMMHTGLHPNYKNLMNQWADRADKYIRRNVGHMDGAIFHHWHGKKTVRGYGDKHRILAKVGFDPTRHLKRDHQGLWQLNDDGSDAFMTLRDEFRRIAHERNEDSIDI